MNKNFHNENCSELYNIIIESINENSELNVLKELDLENKKTKENLFFTNESLKKYYLEQLEVTNTYILQLVKFKDYIRYLPKVLIEFENGVIDIDKNSFNDFYDNLININDNEKLYEGANADGMEVDNAFDYIITLTRQQYFKHQLLNINKEITLIQSYNSGIFASLESEQFFQYVVNTWIKEKKEPLVYISFLFRQLWEKEKENTDTVISDYTIHCKIEEFMKYCNKKLKLSKPINKIKTYNEIGYLYSKQNRIRDFAKIFKENYSNIK